VESYIFWDTSWIPVKINHSFGRTRYLRLLLSTLKMQKNTFLINASKHLPDYMASHPQDCNLHNHCCESFRSLKEIFLLNPGSLLQTSYYSDGKKKRKKHFIFLTFYYSLSISFIFLLTQPYLPVVDTGSFPFRSLIKASVWNCTNFRWYHKNWSKNFEQY
jgi:hypothetical protein